MLLAFDVQKGGAATTKNRPAFIWPTRPDIPGQGLPYVSDRPLPGLNLMLKLTKENAGEASLFQNGVAGTTHHPSMKSSAE
jgi:hypothetical protein